MQQTRSRHTHSDCIVQWYEDCLCYRYTPSPSFLYKAMIHIFAKSSNITRHRDLWTIRLYNNVPLTAVTFSVFITKALMFFFFYHKDLRTNVLNHSNRNFGSHVHLHVRSIKYIRRCLVTSSQYEPVLIEWRSSACGCDTSLRNVVFE